MLTLQKNLESMAEFLCSTQANINILPIKGPQAGPKISQTLKHWVRKVKILRTADAMRFLKTHRTITNSEYQRHFKVAKRTATNDLQLLLSLNLIEKVGTTGKGVFYQISKGVIMGHKIGQFDCHQEIHYGLKVNRLFYTTPHQRLLNPAFPCMSLRTRQEVSVMVYSGRMWGQVHWVCSSRTRAMASVVTSRKGISSK